MFGYLFETTAGNEDAVKTNKRNTERRNPERGCTESKTNRIETRNAGKRIPKWLKGQGLLRAKQIPRSESTGRTNWLKEQRKEATHAFFLVHEDGVG